MAKDHIEVWLAFEPNPAMPVMGWGNQFGETDLPRGELSCPDIGIMGAKPEKDQVALCQDWAHRQRSYRVQLKRLFVRQWLLAPKTGVESFASAAYQQIQNAIAGKEELGFEAPQVLRPQGVPELTVVTAGHGYSFETLIPWNMFPPMTGVSLHDLYLLVEVFSPAADGKKMGPYSTTAPGRGYADFAAFNRIRFEKPKSYAVSACRYPAVAADFFGELKPGFFFPQPQETIQGTFLLENFRGGYAYEPTGMSPVVHATTFYDRKISPGEILCGPALRYFAEGRGTDLTATHYGRTGQIAIDTDSLAYRRLAGGPLLIRQGPHTAWSLFGSGQCGACPRAELVIYSLTEDRKLSELLNIFNVVGNEIDDMDIQILPDWSRVNVYRHNSEWGGQSPGWEDETYCLEGSRYEKCGTGKTPPPEPRTLKLEEAND